MWGLFFSFHKIYGIQVNNGCDIHISFPVCLTDIVHVLLHVGGPVEVTPDIDMDSIKYKDFIILGSAYKFLFVFVTLRPMSTAIVIAGRSVHLTTLFPGQA